MPTSTSIGMLRRAMPTKVQENRVREHARRWNLRLVRTREQYGPIARSYGLVNNATNAWAFAGELGYGKSLDEVEAYLLGDQVVNR